MGILVFNGISTKDLGVVIQTPPVYEFPARRYESINIEGKNGDLLIDKNAFNNVNREYNLASIFRKNESFVESARAFVDWLSTTRGYSRLEDSYEPDYFRLAVFKEGGQLQNVYDEATGMVVKFDCKPQRFLIKGEEPIKITTNDGTYVKIMNPTKYVAEPEITVFNGFISLEVVNGGEISEDKMSIINETSRTIFKIQENFPAITDKTILDSELEDVYTETEYVNNNIILTNGFPKLNPGVNWIKLELVSGESYVNLKPRWWVL